MTQPSGAHEYFRLLAAAAIDGEVTPGEMLELRAHLATCAACRADEQAMRRDNAWLATAEAVLPPRYAVREAVLRAAQGRPTRLRGLGWVAAGAVATLVVAVGAAWWLGFGRGQLGPGAASPAPTGFPSPLAGQECSGDPFAQAISIPTTSAGSVPWSLASADMNADGLLDLVVLNVDPGSVGVMLGDGLGGFSQPRAITPPDPNPLAGSAEPTLIVADVTNDGQADVLVANQELGMVVVFVGDGAGGLAEATSVPVGGEPGWIAVGQYGGDGNLDLAVADESGGVLILIGDGTGAFEPLPRIELGGSPRGIDAGDLDGDGRVDLVVGHDGDHRVDVLLGTGDGAFGPSLVLEGLAATHVNLVDVDTDGDLDALLSNSGPGSVSILLGDGAGSFGAVQVPWQSDAAAPGSTVAIDLDADGHLDIVSNDGVSDQLVVFTGDGSGAFQLLALVPTPDGATGLVAGDFDRDGWPDVATSNANVNSVAVFLNRCGGAPG